MMLVNAAPIAAPIRVIVGLAEVAIVHTPMMIWAVVNSVGVVIVVAVVSIVKAANAATVKIPRCVVVATSARKHAAVPTARHVVQKRAT